MVQNLIVICKSLSRAHPSWAPQIERLARSDNRFRSICEDHNEAIHAAERWESDASDGDVRAEEFRRIAEDLEREAMKYLASMEAS